MVTQAGITDSPAGNAAVIVPSALKAALSVVVCTGVLVAVTHYLEQYLRYCGRLPESAYRQPVIFFGLFYNDWTRLTGVVLCCLPIVLSPLSRWSDIVEYKAIRPVVMITAFAVTWAFSTHSYNFFYDQSHLFDRSLLILLFGLTLWRPCWFPLFLLTAVTIISQFEHPMPGYSWTDKILPVRVLFLFCSYLAVRPLFDPQTAVRTFFLVLFAVTGAHYFVPGWGKVEMEWWNYGHVYHIVAAAWANGWLGFLSEPEINRVIDVAAFLDPLVVGFTLLVEVGSLIFLFHRRIAVGLVLGWFLLHIGIFVFSGICFWKWALLDLAILLSFRQMSPATSGWLFCPKRAFACAALMLVLSFVVTRPVKLAWYDTRLTHTHRFVGTGISGTRYDVGKFFMAPYDLQLAQNRLRFFADQDLIVRTYGTTQNSKLAAELLKSPSELKLEKLVEWDRIDQHDPAAVATFDRFVTTYFRNVNSQLSLKTWHFPAAAPQHIWTMPTGHQFDCREPLEQFAVHLTTTMYDQSAGIVQLSDRPIHVVTIPKVKTAESK
ncbi:MAG: hypothetical protein MK102_17460 [Fuerstiella sp.]|nr:hypothetical protein [Fuerstiella sp.]